jgi:hypothetical protein
MDKTERAGDGERIETLKEVSESPSDTKGRKDTSEDTSLATSLKSSALLTGEFSSMGDEIKA